MWILLIPAGVIVGAWIWGARLVATKAPPLVRDENTNAPITRLTPSMGGFIVGDPILVQPAAAAPVTGKPPLGLVPMRVAGLRAGPNGDQLAVTFTDSSQGFGVRIVPLTAVRR